MARDDDRVLVGFREHVAGIEAHAQRCDVRTHQSDRRGVVLAVFAPAEFLIDDVALQAVGRAEMFTGLGDAVEFVFRHRLRQPVAAVVGEVHLLVFRVPVEADRVAHAAHVNLGARTIQIHPPDLAMVLVMQHVVAGLSDRNIELVVRPDGDELPAMGFVLWKLVIDHDRLRRAVQIVLDLFDLGDLRQFGDIERAVLECDAVRTIEARGDDLDRPLAVLVLDTIDLVDEAAADEYRALVAKRQRARVRHARGIDLDVEAGWQLEFCRRQLVGRSGQRRRRHRSELGGGFIVRTADHRRARRQWGRRGRRRCTGRGGGGGLLGDGIECECTEESTGQQKAARCRRIALHEVLPWRKPFSSRRQ